MLKLTKHLYMSTITSLTKKDMLKIDVSPGEYKLIPFEEGYVFSKTSEDLKNLEIVKIFAEQDGDKGLSGTYYGGQSEDPNQLRLFKTWLYKNFDRGDEMYMDSFVNYDYDELEDEDEDEDDYAERIEARKRELFKYNEYEARYFNFEEYNNYDFHELDRENRLSTDPKYIKSFNSYHNLPFLFYLNKEVTNFDDIQLEESDQIENCGHLWKVYEGEAHIGFVVQKELHCMMGYQAGIGLFEGAVAFGNFHDYFKTRDNQVIDKARRGYQCKFENCECDTQYEETIRVNMLVCRPPVNDHFFVKS